MKDNKVLAKSDVTANKNKTSDLSRLQRRNSELLTGTPLPATTQSKTSMGGDLLQKPTTKEIIPQNTQININDEKFNKQFKKMQEINKNAPELEHIKELYELKRKHNLEPFFYKWSENSYNWRKNLTKETELTNTFIDLKTKKADDFFASLERAFIQRELNIHPIKEFGTNYAEFYHDGKNAVNKLLAEKGGQVSGAFYRDDLGDIDLVWGDDKFGLRHILKRRSEQYGEEKALRFISHLDENIKNGEISYNKQKSTIEIRSPQTTIILAKTKNNNYFSKNK